MVAVSWFEDEAEAESHTRARVNGGETDIREIGVLRAIRRKEPTHGEPELGCHPKLGSGRHAPFPPIQLCGLGPS